MAYIPDLHDQVRLETRDGTLVTYALIAREYRDPPLVEWQGRLFMRGDVSSVFPIAYREAAPVPAMNEAPVMVPMTRAGN